MSEEKQKRDGKQFETEWSFSFEQIGAKINEAFASLGDEVRVETFSVPRGGINRARISLTASIGRLNIYPLENSENVFEAEIAHTGEIAFSISTSADGEATISLKPQRPKDALAPVRQALSSFGKREELYWNIGIHPDVLLSLDLEGLIGPTEANLTRINLAKLDVEGNVGPATFHLPALEHPYDVSLENGVGPVTIVAAATRGVRLNVEGGVGQTTLHIPSGAAMDVDIDGGVGQTVIGVAPDVALRVKASSGIGSLNLPATLTRIKGSDDFVSKSGVWESPGFALASHQVIIHYDGGVGSFRVHQDESEIV